MILISKLLVLASLVWTITSLSIQIFVAWGGGRKQNTAPAGSPLQAVKYNFTSAMMPSHKDTVRLHPLNFLTGIMMHTAAFLSILQILIMTFLGSTLPFAHLTNGILLMGIVATVFMIVHRFRTEVMAKFSIPDDYIAAGMTLTLITVALLAEIGRATPLQTAAFATLFFAYFPLGKLRHSVFFFAARYDLGKRLGHRGTYPPVRDERA